MAKILYITWTNATSFIFFNFVYNYLWFILYAQQFWVVKLRGLLPANNHRHTLFSHENNNSSCKICMLLLLQQDWSTTLSYFKLSVGCVCQNHVDITYVVTFSQFMHVLIASLIVNGWTTASYCLVLVTVKYKANLNANSILNCWFICYWTTIL